MQRLIKVLGTLGVEPVRYLDHDGNHLPQILGEGNFDRVLVDAECSTEAGVNFKAQKPLDGWSVRRIEEVSRLQARLITSGFDLLKRGGILTYSTCTLSPEENEVVVGELLERRPDAFVQPLEFKAEATLAALQNWRGANYPDAVRGTLRIRPDSLMDSFFMAQIIKRGGSNEAAAANALSLDQLAARGMYR
jgi:16S rRNA (cytosine1407-C5)-methyltransferase